MEAYVFTIYIFPRGCRPHMAQVSCKFTPWKGRWESVRIWVGSMNLQETWANSRCTLSSLRHAWWWLWLLCRWCQPPAPLIIKVKFRSIVLLLLQFCVRVWMLDLGSMGRYDHSHSATLHRPNMICQIFFNITFLSKSSRDPTRILRSCPSSSLMHKGWNCLRWGGGDQVNFPTDPTGSLGRPSTRTTWVLATVTQGSRSFAGSVGLVNRRSTDVWRTRRCHYPFDIWGSSSWSIPNSSVFFFYRCHQSHSPLWMLALKRAWVRSRFCWQALM